MGVGLLSLHLGLDKIAVYGSVKYVGNAKIWKHHVIGTIETTKQKYYISMFSSIRYLAHYNTCTYQNFLLRIVKMCHHLRFCIIEWNITGKERNNKSSSFGGWPGYYSTRIRWCKVYDKKFKRTISDMEFAT